MIIDVTRRPLSIVAMLVLSCAIACGTGTIQTAQGPRPVAEVQIQDTIGDVLHSLDLAYLEAVRIHDLPSTVAAETPAVHAKYRATLIAQHDALVAAWNIEVASKQTVGTITPAAVARPLVANLPAFLALAVNSGAMSQASADKVSAFVNALFPPGAQ